MSTTQHTIGEIQAREEPDDVFRRAVFSNPDVCSRCFCQIKSGHRRVMWGIEGRDKEDKGTRAVAKRMYETAPGEIGPEGITIGTREAPNPERAIYPTRTVCASCGSIAGRADDITMSKDEAVGKAETLAQRLREAGEPVDVDVLQYAVGHLKSQERFASHDTECFEAATTVAVRRARQTSR